MSSLPLSAIRIHLAGSIPEEATSAESQGIRNFVQSLASAVLRSGGTMIHGSHPTLREPLKAAATLYIRAGGSKQALTLVRTYSHSSAPDDLQAIEEQRAYAAVQIIPGPLGEAEGNLISMRQWIGERCDVVVAVGGKWYSKNPDRAGVPKELEEALIRGKPGFAIAGFSGSIEGYLRDTPGTYDRLRNGLSETENRVLATSTNVEEIVARIIAQIRLLPLKRETVSSGRLFRVLALDGGGIRGAFTAAVLAKWDDMLRPGGNAGIVKHFDLVAGTSTGAILAIGLALGLPPKQILEFYKTDGPNIFPPGDGWRKWLESRHKSEVLRKTLEKVFGQAVLSRDSLTRLVIPTVRAIPGESEVIVTNHSKDRQGFRDISAVNAALASSAAPTYFDPGFNSDPVADQRYLDGGLWANNPVLPAIVEAVRYLDVPLSRIDVLSVGTTGNEQDFSAQLGKGLAGWAASSADLFFAAQEHAASVLADGLLTRARHFRVNQTTSQAIALDDTFALPGLIRRGDTVGMDSFAFVRSRFLDGNHAPPWREALQ